MKKITVITGVSGYIGGQTALMLKDAGERVIGIDRRPLPLHLTGVCDRFIQEDFASTHALSAIVLERPDAVVHCAGTSLVGPSMADPKEYYNNNFVGLLRCNFRNFPSDNIRRHTITQHKL